MHPLASIVSQGGSALPLLLAALAFAGMALLAAPTRADIQTRRQKFAELFRASEEIRTSGPVLTPEQSAKWEQLTTEAEQLKQGIDRDERALGLQAALLATEGTPIVPAAPPPTPAPAGRGEELEQRDFDRAFGLWLKGRPNALARADRRVQLAFSRRGFQFGDAYGVLPSANGRQEGDIEGFRLWDGNEASRFGRIERRVDANMSKTATAGLELVPEGFVPRVESAMKWYGGILEAGVEVLRTDSGNDLPWPTDDDTGNAGAMIAEETDIGDTVKVATSSVTLKAWKGTSKQIRFSQELLEDAAFPMESWLGEKVGERIGRLLNAKCTTGAGTTEPKGIQACATSAFSENAALSRAILLRLKHSVDRAYRAQNPRWMFSDGTLLEVKKMTTGSDDLPLWRPGLADGEPSTIDGDPYVINEDLEDYATSSTQDKKVILYGAMRYFKVRIVRSMRLIVLRELYAETDQLAVQAFIRFDSNITQAAAIKAITNNTAA